MADEGEQDDVSFLRTEDMVCLQCTATGGRVCLAAEGFGNRHCYLENIADKNFPPEMSCCVFVIEQALSVRALQEMVTAANNDSGTSGSGHRTLLYGHAVLLRHQNSGMFLACLSTSSSNDKLAFDVGLREHCQGEACWWTIHPASKQRSEGEKVRVGDELIFVSVATERYLHTTIEGDKAIVNASFHLTHWSVAPFGTGMSRIKSVGFVFGGEVLRFYHGGDECLTIPANWSEAEGGNMIIYEGGAVLSQARSLWRLELVRTKWAGGFVNWGYPLRVRHITTGRYMSFNDNREVTLVTREEATVSQTAFCLRQTKDDKKIVLDEKEEEVIGSPLIKYGDTTVFLQHLETGLWLSYKTYETKKKGVGKVEEKQAIMSEEGKMDDGLEFSRSQEEESKTARVIRKCGALFTKFITGLDNLPSCPDMFLAGDLDEMVTCLEDLIQYFAQPQDDIEHEEKQTKLKALRNRQDLCQEEGILNLILETIDKINTISSQGYLSVGEDTAQRWETISGYLYQLLAAIIKGNHTNCAQFAQAHRLDWLFSRLGSQQAAEGTGMLDVLHCVLIDSPEALNMMKEAHIKVIISLLEKHGRDPKVLDVLCSLCVGNGVAVRSSQNNICDNLLPGRNLLLQTRLVDHVASMRPNIYVGKVEGAPIYRRWYFEAMVDHLETVSHLEPHFRVGWANTRGYVPYPGPGTKWGGNGVGDDLYSYGFDGAHMWTGGRGNKIRNVTSPYIQKGDVIGCILDLNVPLIRFTVNGVPVPGQFRNFNTEDGMFYPVISFSAKLSCRFILGGDQGRLRYGPPDDHSPIVEGVMPNQEIRVEPCFQFGELMKGVLCGPTIEESDVAFVPQPVDTSNIQLPGYIESVRDKLAENIHEVWAMNKIESGWTYGEVRDDVFKKHPCLTSFERLPAAEKKYDTALALQTLRTIIALGYHISVDKPPARIKTFKLHNDPFLQSNGYKPAPLDLANITLSAKMEELVELLAENTHNVWARERIQQHWTYGLNEDSRSRRSPHLVPYRMVDDAIKKANRDTASETVRTLIAYGYVLEPPVAESTEGIPGSQVQAKMFHRTYRAEQTYAVTSGKWYFEFEILTEGPMKVGWVTLDCSPSIAELGSDDRSWAYDGFRAHKVHAGSKESYGKQWQVGDVVGCLLDLNDRTIGFTLNGELLLDVLGGEMAFTDLPAEGFVPAFTLSTGQKARLTFGQDINHLKFFTTCGLQEGFQPFCVNMTRTIAFWYTKEDTQFVNVEDVPGVCVDVVRVPPSGESPPALKICHNQYENVEKVSWEFLRLGLPVTFKDHFITEDEKCHRWEEIKRLQQRQKTNVRHPANLEEHMLKSGFSISDVKDLQRGYSEDAAEAEDVSSPGSPTMLIKTRSIDHLSPEPVGGITAGLRSAASEEALAKKGDHAPPAELPERKRRGKSPFRFFRKNMEKRETTEPVVMNGDVMTERKGPVTMDHLVVQGAPLIATPKVPERAMSPRRGSRVKLGAEHPEEEAPGDQLDSSCLELLDEYFYGIRIFPGQDPSHVYCGWVNTTFKQHESSFDTTKVRKVTYIGLSEDGTNKEILERQDCYLVCAGQLHAEVSQDEGASRTSNQGMFVGCFVDTITGTLTFMAEGKATRHRFRVEPGTKLFPAVFFEATSKEVLQFELGRTPTTLPLSAALLQTTGKHVTPQCPPRLKVQCLQAHSWARVPDKSLRPHALKLSDIRGWSLLCEDPVSMLAVHIPEEDRCLDILELIEMEKLLLFHAHTLVLYGALCFQGNHRAAHLICNHVDSKQLLYAIQSQYMSGPLRLRFADLLISLHLEAFAYSRTLTQNEFIIPLVGDLKEMYESPEASHQLNTLQSVSLMSEVAMSPIQTEVTSIKDLSTPFFPLDELKNFVMEALRRAVYFNNFPMRDPIGGSNTCLFVPLIKLADKLLLIGFLEDADLESLLILIDPETFDPDYVPEGSEGEDLSLKGLVQMPELEEGPKLELCHLLHHLLSIQLRHRVEGLVAFCHGFVAELQTDQLRRYISIKQEDLPAAVAARKTREFRCAPKNQMRYILSFKNIEDEGNDQCPCGEGPREALRTFHEILVTKMKVVMQALEEVEEAPAATEDGGTPSTASKWTKKLFSLIKLVKAQAGEEEQSEEEKVEIPKGPEDQFIKKIVGTVTSWAQASEIENTQLVREMFRLLLRLYNGPGELIEALNNTYVMGETSKGDILKLLEDLTKVRSLLPVQMEPEEEEIMRTSLWAMVSNRVFFQHPDLIRILKVHEDVIAVMMNTLGKRAQTSESSEKDTSHEMVVSCCRFLCFFCRSSRQNQRAMFDQLDFLLDNSNILLSRPSLRGSTPLDVAISSVMENSELALALREQYLEKIAVYLSRCGLQFSQDLLDRGYPDIQWDPVEGERYLDFLKFCVWVNGESVEENANLVIRLLIRRPECLGPALRGEGPGLLTAIKEAIKMSEKIQAENEAAGHSPGDEDEDYIDIGAAILNFYCALVDLLGRCAPEAATIAQGKNDCIRARAILKSLVPMEDLEGVLSLRFNLKAPGQREGSDMPVGLQPNHKQSIVLFLERVYGIEEQETFFRLLEDGFLPDLRAATMLEKTDGSESEMALALNRYIGNSILPTVIKYCHYFGNAESYLNLIEATLHTIYRLSKVKILTKGQRERVSDFLVALTSEMHPSMLLRLLRKLTVDVSALNEYTTVALRLLTLNYERCGKYYGTASEEEKRLTMMLFTNIFDSLAKMEYDPDLFSKALPCLTAIACALPPDYSLLSVAEEDWNKVPSSGPYVPEPIPTSNIQLPHDLTNLLNKFAEHYHDAWASRKFENGWTYGEYWSDEKKNHPRLKPYGLLTDREKERYEEPARESLKALLALGWKLEATDASRAAANRPASPKSESTYSPQPVDMSNLTLSRDLQTMSERLAENNHDIWARKMKSELDAIGGGVHPQLVPYDLLTDKEKYKYRDRAQELLKFLQYQSYKVYKTRKEDRVGEMGAGGGSPPEVRFASSLLDKLLHYMDITAIKMKILKPSHNFSRRNSFKTSSRDVKFFSKVVLPLMEKYFSAHRNFFLTSPTVTSVTTAGVATIKEKEMVASLFCKMAGLLRTKFSVVGTDAPVSVRCLRVLIQATDARSIVKSSPDFVKTSMLTFFNNASDDLAQTMTNLSQGKFSQLRGTTLKTSSSLTYIQLVLIPVLTALFDHLASQEFGTDLLLNDLQVACYKILNSLFTLGTSPDLSKNRKFIKTELDRHRPAVGNCLGAFAGTFPVAFLEPHLNKHNPLCIHSTMEQQSLEAQTVMAELETSMPTLDDLMGQFEKFVSTGVRYSDSPYIIDIILPLLCSYLPFWWSQGPDNVNPTGGNHVTMVTSDHLNTFLSHVFNLIRRQVGLDNAPWMVTLAAHAGQVVMNVSEELLADPVLPLAELLRARTEAAFHKEEMARGYLKSGAEDTSQIEAQLQDEWNLLVRDIYAYYPLLIKYVDLQRAHWLKLDIPEAETLYTCVAYIFNIWSKSMFFRKEEQNFISQHEIDNMALIMPAAGRGRVQIQTSSATTATAKKVKKKRDVKRDKDKELASSLIVACLKRLLPIGLNLFAGREQELVQHAKEKFLKQKCPESEISEFIKTQLTLPDKIDPADTMSWQHILYSQLGSGAKSSVNPDVQVDRILDMAKVLQGLHLIDHPPTQQKGVTRSLVSMQRKRAVIACFRMTSLHSLPRHRAINIYLNIYCDIWLQEENQGQEQLIDDITESFEDAEVNRSKQVEKEEKSDPLSQLVVAFSRNATMEHSGQIPEDPLYMEYANIFSKSCGGAEEEEEEEGGGDEEGPSIHEQEMEKQKCLFHQARLADRGVAEMVLFFLSASKGVQGPMVVETLKCGISLLLGGNTDVQMRMLKHLKEKKDAGFFTSVAALMNSCSVLDLDAFERNQKAEGLGMGSDCSAGKKNMHDAEFTCFLFRFLQLLCEGHNLEFQNYLRTQAGNTTTVNVVISTVDYLLRLQESIMDFYWSYSSKPLIDPPGKENFCRAIKVARQVFNTLTEFIQGPCSLNQQALAHSRLWDAVGGFLFLFAHMQDKLSKHSSQLDLLRDLLELQKDMVIMMLSMLEGNVVNGTIGKQMVDTLVESAANVENILVFFNMFLKLKGLIASTAMSEYDPKKTGWITAKDFKRAMEQQKIYTSEEIDYLMSCCEPNHDGLIDYLEFTDRFHNPAKDIGFNLAVLLTNLSEHMPSDPRLSRFLETASSVLNYFEPFLGRIEILGGANRIERVYFEIKEANIEQWEEPQIKDSKRAFFYSIVTEGGEKGKLEAFVNFCEDAIFEMQHASSISKEEEDEAPTSASRYPFPGSEEEKPPSVLDPVKNAFWWVWLTLGAWLSLLTPSNLKAQAARMAQKSPVELLVDTGHFFFSTSYFVAWLFYKVSRTLVKLILVLMGGEVLQQPEEEEVDKTEVLFKPAALPAPMPLDAGGGPALALDAVPASPPASTIPVAKDGEVTPVPDGDVGDAVPAATTEEQQQGGQEGAETTAVAVKEPSEPAAPPEAVEEPEAAAAASEAAKVTEPPPPVAAIDFAEYGQKLVSFLARKFYTMKWIALMIAFIINFMLLFYKVTSAPTNGEEGEEGSDEISGGLSGEDSGGLNVTAILGADDEGSGEEEDVEEWLVMENELFKIAIQLLSVIHSIVAFCMLVSYYHLKVPLAIFKREKEIARAMEFDGLYITDESSEEELATKWDRYVISSRSFPVNYWDKFVKKRVREKYSEMYDYDSITKLLALDTSYSPGAQTAGFLAPLWNVDWRYQVWKAGVTITDKAFLYYLLYFIFSMLGNIHSFFFAAHLLDVAVNIKSLKTILQSVTHNGKQLLLTVMLLTIVVYIYTVFAFLFFRKFYVQEEDEQVDQKCHSMFTCFIFHLYKGVRAGGGIGDEIEAPDGDDYEFYRIFFDITFFFFVIVILLAIIQGLIIDAFGELRDQLQSVSDDMESNCFICGIPKDYFDKVPHGFDTHVQKEHNLANYMFFLMHLINKPDTEYTGQETYVWEMYQKRCWDFFPVGDCFRKQYEDVLMGGGGGGPSG